MDQPEEYLFENDIAKDWLYEFSIYPGINLIEMSLFLVTQERSYISKTSAQEALVACEVLARLNGQTCFKNQYTQVIDQWVEQTEEVLTDRLKNKAHYAIDKILSPQSELMKTYIDDDCWVEALSNLKKRVKA